MTAKTALIVLDAVYVIMSLALLLTVAHVFGLIWLAALGPVEIIGGFAFGVLVYWAGDQR